MSSRPKVIRWKGWSAGVVAIAATLLAAPGILPPVVSDESRPSGPATAEESAVANEARQALATMVQLLENGQYEQFFLDHSPGRDYAMMQEMLAKGRLFPKLPPSFVQKFIDHAKAMQQMDIVIRSNKVAAVFVPAAASDDNADKPVAANPYAEMIATNTPGYGQDLSEAIRLALADLSSGQSEEFASKMFPPSTTAMIKTEKRWDYVVSQLAPGTDQFAAMQKDLQLLETLEPEIQGDTASYTVDRVVTAFPVSSGRPRFGAPATPAATRTEQSATTTDGKREIRFSLVDGHWRFYDNSSQLTAKISDALNQKMSPGLTADDSPYGMVKMGRTWRLTPLPAPQR